MIATGPFTGGDSTEGLGPYSRRPGHVPALRSGVALEERRQKCDHFLGPVLGRMGAVVVDVLAGPLKTVVAACKAVRPEIRAPGEPRAFDLAAHALLDQGTYCISAVVGGGLGIQSRHRVAGVCPAREIDDLQARIAEAHRLD